MMEDKRSQYELLCAQVKSLMEGESNVMGVLANITAAMHDTFPDTFFGWDSIL